MSEPMPTCECGHARDSHATGGHRSNWPCEAPGCDCEDYAVSRVVEWDKEQTAHLLESLRRCSKCGGLGWIIVNDSHGPREKLPCPLGCRPDRWVPPAEMEEG